MSAPALQQYVQGQGAVSADNLNTFAQTTDLVTDLRAFIGTQGMEVLVRGTTVVNDSGGGAFYWNPTGTGPDDGVNTIVPSGAAIGCWVRVNSASVQNNVTLTGTTTLPGGGRISSAGFLGLGMVPVNVLDITQSQNGISIVSILNTNGGAAADARYVVSNGVSQGTFEQFGPGYASSGILRANGTLLNGSGAGGLTLSASASQPIYFAIASVEVARIDTSGNLLVGATSPLTNTTHNLVTSSTNQACTIVSTHASAPNGLFVKYTNAAPNNTSQYFVLCTDSGTTRHQLRSDGGLANFSANNVNLSDASVKDVLEPLSEVLPALWEAHKSIEWCRFKYNDQTHDDWNYGYTAQEIRARFSNVVPGITDSWDGQNELLGVYSEDLKNIGAAVLSEAQRRIEDLEAKVSRLEALLTRQ